MHTSLIGRKYLTNEGIIIRITKVEDCVAYFQVIYKDKTMKIGCCHVNKFYKIHKRLEGENP